MSDIGFTAHQHKKAISRRRKGKISGLNDIYVVSISILF